MNKYACLRANVHKLVCVRMFVFMCIYVCACLRFNVFVCLHIYVLMRMRVLQNYFRSFDQPNFTAFPIGNTSKICHSFISFLSLPKGFLWADSSDTLVQTARCVFVSRTRASQKPSCHLRWGIGSAVAYVFSSPVKCSGMVSSGRSFVTQSVEEIAK